MPKILVVDDDPKICRLFEVVLKKSGYEVVIAYTAEDGLRMALEELPDVILSDYMLPDEDGEKFCIKVRNNKKIASTPFIVITGRGTQTLKMEGLSKLFDDYLEKPVDLSFLTAKVNATIRRRNEEKIENQKKTTKFRTIVTGLTIITIVASGFVLGYRARLNSQQQELTRLTKLKNNYDRRILELENQLDSVGLELDDLDFERLNHELNHLIRNAKIIAKQLPQEKERDIVVRGIKQIMAEFGEDNYNVPPLFAQEVARMIEKMSGPQRHYTEKVLKRSKLYMPMIRSIFEEKGLPEGLAYIAMIESGFNPTAVNPKSGATGMWQFMTGTAREYGLRVSRTQDERTDPLKSTVTASEYLQDLIGVFGKKSFLLAVASYNVGDGIVRYQLKKLYNPLEERDFWYLFRKKALPEETREYIPKLIASIIIHRNQEEFGFHIKEDSNLAEFSN